jgi:hypothetical protein
MTDADIFSCANIVFDVDKCICVQVVVKNNVSYVVEAELTQRKTQNCVCYSTGSNSIAEQCTAANCDSKIVLGC